MVARDREADRPKGGSVKACEVCGQEAREVVPFLRANRSVYAFPNPYSVLPRSALTDEQNAAIPWGSHPDDDRFGTACPACATSMRESN